MDKKLKKVFTSIKTRAESVGGGSSRNGGTAITINGATAGDGSSNGKLLESINSFCETGGPGNPNPGEEFLYLPTIVDIAESTPSSASLAASAIRKNLDLKHISRPYVQYNSVMLMRILAQNPGATFTRNLSDAKFTAAVKELIRHGRDPSVYQILCETLEHFLTDPARVLDENLTPLRDVWLKEKSAGAQQISHSPPQLQPPLPPLPPRNTLPRAEELAARISEATTSATLLQQLVQSTPQSELIGHELIKEFADRCKLAAESMQAYISADSPAADPDTLTTLIETNDVLGTALESHRKAMAATLRARETTVTGEARLANVPDMPPQMRGAVTATEPESPVSPLSPTTRQKEADGNVFRF